MNNNKKEILDFINPASLLQLLIFSQALWFSAIFWLITSSELSAIYGFMLGSMSTTVAVLYQCHKIDFTAKKFSMELGYKLYSRFVFWLYRPLLTGVVFFFYTPSMA